MTYWSDMWPFVLGGAVLVLAAVVFAAAWRNRPAVAQREMIQLLTDSIRRHAAAPEGHRLWVKVHPEEIRMDGSTRPGRPTAWDGWLRVTGMEGDWVALEGVGKVPVEHCWCYVLADPSGKAVHFFAASDVPPGVDPESLFPSDVEFG